jgi:hypothetical protein
VGDDRGLKKFGAEIRIRGGENGEVLEGEGNVGRLEWMIGMDRDLYDKIEGWEMGK